MAALRLALVVGSLVAFAILLSPVSPLSFRPDGPAPTASVEAEEPIDEAKIAPAEVTPEDFEECNSLNDSIQPIIAGAGKNETYKIAADLLLGEYCNRPELVHKISTATEPGLNIVAYSCEAASGIEGDSALQDSLADHTVIYCESSRAAIETELESLTTSIQGFREDFLPMLKEMNAEGPIEVYDIESISSELDRISGLVEGSRSLLNSGEHYDASQMLEMASGSFTGLLETIET